MIPSDPVLLWELPSDQHDQLFRRLLMLRLRAPAQHRLAGGGGLVETAARSQARGGAECFGISGFRPLGKAAQYRDELIKRLLALGLGRLDQQRAVHDKRE